MDSFEVCIALIVTLCEFQCIEIVYLVFKQLGLHTKEMQVGGGCNKVRRATLVEETLKAAAR